MGQALYRKYRSKSLAEVVGQEHITTTLAHALKTGKISHAYLLTGPRGVGKTSVARILAHEINGLPYDDDSMHLDIIEIDAASNRRIDEIRDLRDKVNIAPTSAKYKIYIIDEVHMLTKEAFNALLKTLEEPPAHVVFVLATTDAHKLPDTIVSRTQRFTFKPVPLGQVVGHLRMIADEEGIKITDEALELIAAHGEGSFRDSISLLDQAGGQAGKVDLAAVQQMLGIPPLEAVQAITAALLEHNAALVVGSLAQVRERGFQPQQIAKRLGEAWRGRLLENGRASSEDFRLLQNLLDVPSKPNPERYLEIVLLEFALAQSHESRVPSQDEPGKPGHEREPKSRHSHGDGNPNGKKITGDRLQVTGQKAKLPTSDPRVPASDIGHQSSNAGNLKLETPASETGNPSPVTSAKLNETLWLDVLAALKAKYNTLYGVARLATPIFGDGTLELEFSFPFHKKRLSEPKNQQVLADTIQAVTGRKVAISCTVVPRETKPEPAAVELAAEAPLLTAAPADISSISNIFGGAEVIQS